MNLLIRSQGEKTRLRGEAMLSIQEDDKGVLFWVKVQPRSTSNKLDGFLDGCLRLRVTAPPVKGAANRAVQELLAELLGVSKSRVEIVSGYSKKNKLIRVTGLTEEQLRDFIS